MSKLFIISLLSILFLSCNQSKKDNSESNVAFGEDTITTEKTGDIQPPQSVEIVLGEDIENFYAYVKNIYKIGNTVYIDVDVVEVEVDTEEGITVTNNNPKIRTYIVDSETIIYGKHCGEMTLNDLLNTKDSILNDDSILLVGGARSGRMSGLNFGCYG